MYGVLYSEAHTWVNRIPYFRSNNYSKSFSACERQATLLQPACRSSLTETQCKPLPRRKSLNRLDVHSNVECISKLEYYTVICKVLQSQKTCPKTDHLANFCSAYRIPPSFHRDPCIETKPPSVRASRISSGVTRTDMTKRQNSCITISNLTSAAAD